MTYTKEQKNNYFTNLRTEWKKSKAMAENDQLMQALYREAGVNFSYWSFAFTKYEMDAKGLHGTPYIDCKTFNGWRDAGFIVNKGEKSVIRGITWIHPKGKDGDEDETFLYPKVYNLFHVSQVSEIK